MRVLLVATMLVLMLVPASAADPLPVEGCHGHDPGVRVHYQEKVDTGCIEIPPPQTTASGEPGPTYVYVCPTSGYRIVVNGEMISDCYGPPPQTASAAGLPVRGEPCPYGTSGYQLWVGNQQVMYCEGPQPASASSLPVSVKKCDGYDQRGYEIEVLGVPLMHCTGMAVAASGPPVAVEDCPSGTSGSVVRVLKWEWQFCEGPQPSSQDTHFKVEKCPPGTGGLAVWVNGQQVMYCHGPAPVATDAAASARPVEVEECDGYGMYGYDVTVAGTPVMQCWGEAQATSAPFPVQPCGAPGQVAYRAELGPVATTCIPVLEVYACPGGGGYVVILGTIATGQCSICCEPTPLAAGPAPTEEVLYACGGGMGVQYREKVDTGCIPLGCNITCEEAAVEASYKPAHVYGCYTTVGVEVYGVHDTGCIPNGCMLGCEAASDAEALPLRVDTRCNAPAHGIEVFYDGRSLTGCIPLPNGV